MNADMTRQIDNKKKFAVSVRKNILDMAVSAGSSSAHFGGALSITEIVSTLFAHQMKLDKKKCIQDAEKLGWEIPDHEWEIKKTKRGRPKIIKPDITVVEDSDEDEYENTEVTEEDIIANLIADCY